MLVLLRPIKQSKREPSIPEPCLEEPVHLLERVSSQKSRSDIVVDENKGEFLRKPAKCVCVCVHACVCICIHLNDKYGEKKKGRGRERARDRM